MSVIKKFVMGTPELTSRDVGVNQMYFENYIINKPLRVEEEYKLLVLIKDSNDELHTVRRSLVMEVQHNV